jgi:hypothetical protein
MSFYQKYDLERLVADGAAKTFRAKENATGQQVFLHLFNPGGEPVLAAIKSKLGGGSGRPVWPLLEVGEFAGSPYVVTDVIEPFTTLRDWVASILSAPLPAAPAPAQEGAAPIQRPVFPERPVVSEHPILPERSPLPEPVVPEHPVPTQEPRLYKEAGESVVRRDLPVQAPPLNLDEQITGGSPAASTPKAGPGEFTRWFELPAAKPPVKPASSPPLQPKAEPGDFTRWFEPAVEKPAAKPPAKSSLPPPAPPQPDTFENLFGAGATPQPRNDPRPPAASLPIDPGTGEFTRLFGRSPAGEHINIEEEQARAALAAPPENRPFQAPGDFTRMFGPEMQSPAPQRTPPAHRPSSDTASSIFAPLALPTKPAPPPGQPAAGPAGLSNAAPPEPGEYTRIISTPRDPAQPAAAPKPPEPAPVQPASKKGLIIGLSIGAAVLVIAVILLLIFAAREK